MEKEKVESGVREKADSDDDDDIPLNSTALLSNAVKRTFKFEFKGDFIANDSFIHANNRAIQCRNGIINKIDRQNVLVVVDLEAKAIRYYMRIIQYSNKIYIYIYTMIRLQRRHVTTKTTRPPNTINDKEIEELMAENARLRAELEKLKNAKS